MHIEWWLFLDLGRFVPDRPKKDEVLSKLFHTPEIAKRLQVLAEASSTEAARTAATETVMKLCKAGR